MKKSPLFTLFLIVFFDLVGFGIVIPILPYYAQSYGASAWTLGWLMASYSLMQFLFAPVWGKISDHIGRRPVLLISIFGSCISMLVLGFAPSLTWLFIGRFFAGICGANISTAFAYITDVTTEENRTKGMGVIGAGFGLGFIFGPAVGGVLSRFGYAAPMFAGSGLALINLFFAYFKLHEPGLSTEIRASHRNKRFDWKLNRKILADPRTRFATLTFLLVTLAVAQMEMSFAIFLKAKFNFTAESAGILLALSGLIMAGMQGGLIGKLSKKWGEINLIRYGSLLCAIALIGFAHAPTIALIVCSLFLLGVGHGALHPSLSSLASKGAQKDLRGATLGVFQSGSSLARIIGPPVAGFLYDHAGQEWPFYCGAVILGGCFLMTLSAIKA